MKLQRQVSLANNLKRPLTCFLSAKRIGPSAGGKAGAEVQCAGREEKADTLLILVVGRQFPIYIMV
jgi:hypothetical protein